MVSRRKERGNADAWFNIFDREGRIIGKRDPITDEETMFDKPIDLSPNGAATKQREIEVFAPEVRVLLDFNGDSDGFEEIALGVYDDFDINKLTDNEVLALNEKCIEAGVRLGELETKNAKEIFQAIDERAVEILNVENWVATATEFLLDGDFSNTRRLVANLEVVADHSDRFPIQVIKQMEAALRSVREDDLDSEAAKAGLRQIRYRAKQNQ